MRTDSRLSWLFLALFFAMVWLPHGQIDFLAAHWMKIGAYIAPLLMFLAFKKRAGADRPAFTDVPFVAMALAAAYLAHQVEEHRIDLLGREYALYDTLNGLVARMLGPDAYGVFTPTAIFYVNSGTVWAVALTAIAASNRHVFPALAMAGLMLVNGVAHVLAGVIGFAYNAGLATSIALFLPLSIAFFAATRRIELVTTQRIVAAVAWGALAHVILFAGLFLSNVYGIIPTWAYYAFLIGYGLSPLVMFRDDAAPAPA